MVTPEAGPVDESHLVRLGGALRTVQDRVVHTAAPPDITAEAAAALERAAALLRPYMYDGAETSWEDIGQRSGTRTLGPVLTDVLCDGQHLEATVRFTPFYLGGNGAVHGGALPLVFDAALANLTNFERPRGRTAYLRVDYRSVTLVGRELRIDANMERIDGRKRYVAGTMYDGDTVTAEAAALYVELKPGAA